MNGQNRVLHNIYKESFDITLYLPRQYMQDTCTPCLATAEKYSELIQPLPYVAIAVLWNISTYPLTYPH